MDVLFFCVTSGLFQQLKDDVAVGSAMGCDLMRPTEKSRLILPGKGVSRALQRRLGAARVQDAELAAR